MIVEWLNSADRKILRRLAELIAVNGGNMTVTTAGKSVATTENRYGRSGLQVQEAMELVYMNGFWDALSMNSTPERRSEAHKLVGMEISLAAGVSDLLIPTPEQVRELLRY